jgi:hypothetical protein|tara:strand:- start:4291 stop:6075 length:1785 start_codon:yes stop_codon:yes gene_type:complete
MVFYVGAALGKIGEAIQADTAERRASRREEERYERNRTDLIMDKAIDTATQLYYKKKEAAEAERAAVEKLMSRLETTGLDVDERFRIAQGGESAVNDIMDRFNTWTATFGEKSDSTLEFGDFYDIQKSANENTATDYSSLTNKEFLDLFMRNTVKYDSAPIQAYLAQYGMSLSQEDLPDYFQFADSQADETEAAIPTLGTLTVNQDALKEALADPEKALEFASITEAIDKTNLELIDLNIAEKAMRASNQANSEEHKALIQKINEKKYKLDRYNKLKPTESKKIDELIGDTVQQLNEARNADEPNAEKVKQLENDLDFYLGKSAIIKNAGKVAPLNEVVANTTMEIDKLNRLDPVANKDKIEELQATQIAALKSIQAIQEAKEKAQEKYKGEKEPTKSKGGFTSITGAQNFVLKAKANKLSSEYFIASEGLETQYALKFAGADENQAKNYRDYISKMDSNVLPYLNGLINNDKYANTDVKNPYKDDKFLLGPVGAELEDFKSNLKDYFLKFKNNKTLKVAGTDENVHSGIVLSEEQILDGQTIKKLSREGKLKPGDFFELKIPTSLTDDAFIQLIWTGKNIYSLNLQTNQMESY